MFFVCLFVFKDDKQTPSGQGEVCLSRTIYICFMFLHVSYEFIYGALQNRAFKMLTLHYIHTYNTESNI